MRVNPVSGQVLEGPLEPVYVYEAPVRLWHWVMMVAMFVLAGTGYLIGSPLPSIGGEATFHYLFGYIRTIHFIAGMIFAIAFLVRVYWAIVGNHSSRAIFIPPVWNGSWWKGLFDQMGYYLFLKKESALWVGHNPLAQIAMFAMYTLGTIFIIITGFALYAEAVGLGKHADEPDGLGVRAVRRSADGAHAASPRDVVPGAVRGHPHVHGVPRGHHERPVGDRHHDQRHPHVEERAEALTGDGVR